MAHYHSWDGICPHCKKPHTVDFIFYSPDDNSEDIETVKCYCGCVFEVTACAEVDISIYTKGVKTITLPNSDIEAEEYHSNDPNQISLL